MFHLPLINGRIRPGDVAWRLGARQIHLIRRQMHHSSLPCAKASLSPTSTQWRILWPRHQAGRGRGGFP